VELDAEERTRYGSRSRSFAMQLSSSRACSREVVRRRGSGLPWVRLKRSRKRLGNSTTSLWVLTWSHRPPLMRSIKSRCPASTAAADAKGQYQELAGLEPFWRS
jgi:hypothetical protein